MISLPFVRPPKTRELRKLGNATSGVLEFPVLGGLTVGESALINELMANEQSAFVEGARIADGIAKAEGISLSEAFAIIEDAVRGRALEERAEEIRLHHAARIDALSRLYAAAGQKNMAATVTALIACRLEQPQWSLQDTKTLHRTLFDAIWALAQEEQEAEAQDPPAPPDEESLGKQPEDSGESRKRIGVKSAGT